MLRPPLLLLTALLPLAIEAQAPDVAKLTFAWPAKMIARVDAQKYRERTFGPRNDTNSVAISYRMSAQRTGDEYVVSFDDFRVPDGATPPMKQELASFTDRIGALVPAYRVSAGGEFKRLESTAIIRALVDSAFKAIEAEKGPTPPQAKQLLQAMMSDAVLASAAAQEWNALVGSWVDAELEVGQAYGTEGEEEIPILQGATMKFLYEFGVLRRLSCDSVAAPNARDCVELQMVSMPDSAALRQFLDRFMSTMLSDVAKGVAFTEFNVENVVSLVAHPESLLPVSLVVSKEVTATMQAEGTTEKLYQLDVKTLKYRYER